MEIDDSPESGLSQPTDRQGVPADIDQMLESIGARYIADLRSLSEAFNQFYTALLAAKDAQLIQLDRRAAAAERERDEQRATLAEKDIQIAQLGERVRRLERERDERDAYVNEFSRIGARYLADLQNLASHIGIPVPQPAAAVVTEPAPAPTTAELEPSQAGERANGRSQAKPARIGLAQPTLRFVGAEYHLAKVDRFAGESGQQVALGE